MTDASFIGLSGPAPDEPESFVFTQDKAVAATPLDDDHVLASGPQQQDDGLFGHDPGWPDLEHGGAGRFYGPRGLPEHDWIL